MLSKPQVTYLIKVEYIAEPIMREDTEIEHIILSEYSVDRRARNDLHRQQDHIVGLMQHRRDHHPDINHKE